MSTLKYSENQPKSKESIVSLTKWLISELSRDQLRELRASISIHLDRISKVPSTSINDSKLSLGFESEEKVTKGLGDLQKLKIDPKKPMEAKDKVWNTQLSKEKKAYRIKMMANKIISQQCGAANCENLITAEWIDDCIRSRSEFKSAHKMAERKQISTEEDKQISNNQIHTSDNYNNEYNKPHSLPLSFKTYKSKASINLKFDKKKKNYECLLNNKQQQSSNFSNIFMKYKVEHKKENKSATPEILKNLKVSLNKLSQCDLSHVNSNNKTQKIIVEKNPRLKTENTEKKIGMRRRLWWKCTYLLCGHFNCEWRAACTRCFNRRWKGRNENNSDILCSKCGFVNNKSQSFCMKCHFQYAIFKKELFTNPNICKPQLCF